MKIQVLCLIQKWSESFGNFYDVKTPSIRTVWVNFNKFE